VENKHASHLAASDWVEMAAATWKQLRTAQRATGTSPRAGALG